MSEYSDLDREIDRDLGIKDPNRRRWLAPATWAKKIEKLWESALLRGLRKLAFFPVFSPIRFQKPPLFLDKPKKSPLLLRFLEGAISRLIITPILIGVFMIALVWTTTHPAQVRAQHTPALMGLLYQNVNFVSSDGHLLRGWYLPPLTAEDVMKEGESVLQRQWPAAVLCHSLGATNEEYLPLAARLHAAGFAVLMMSPRGQGESNPGAVTFGLRERFDVLAAVSYLRELPAVDGTKICVVGSGLGGVAALEGARLDSAIAAVVADGAWPTFEAWNQSVFERAGVAGRWFTPLYTVMFEVALRERTGELDLRRVVHELKRPKVLFVARNGPEQTPVSEVLSLAAGMPGEHRVLVASAALHAQDATGEKEICSFLCDAVAWKLPEKRVPAEVERLFESRVK